MYNNQYENYEERVTLMVGGQDQHNVTDDIPQHEFDEAVKRFIPTVEKYINGEAGIESTANRIFNMITGPVMIKKEKVKPMMSDIKLSLEAIRTPDDMEGAAAFFVERQEVIRGI